MEIREYLRILRRRAWIPIALVVATVVATGVLVYLSKPEYTATATVIAKAPAGSISLNFGEVVASNTVALRVRQELKLGMTAADLASAVKVNSGRSSIYSIAFTDPKPDRAVAIANAYAKDAAAEYMRLGGTQESIVQSTTGDLTTFQQNYLTAAKALGAFRTQHPDIARAVDELTAEANGSIPRDVKGDPLPAPVVDSDLAAQYRLLTLNANTAAQTYTSFNADVSAARIAQINAAATFEATVVDQAVAKPDTTSRLLKIVYAAILALIIGVGLIFAAEYFDNAVREPDEAEELVGAPVIAIIPRGTARTLRPARRPGSAA